MPYNRVNPDYSDLSNSSTGNRSPASCYSSSPGHTAQSVSPIDPQRFSNLNLVGMDNNMYDQQSYFSNSPYNNEQNYQAMPVTISHLVPPSSSSITTFNYHGTDNYTPVTASWSNGMMMPQENTGYSGNYLQNMNSFQGNNNIISNTSGTIKYPGTLEIVEPPVEKFRFRYKSEMHGTHGSLNGANSKRSPKTFPEVRLVGFSGDAVIRCSLFQVKLDSPHSHQLVVRKDEMDINDPHDVEVGPGVIAQFQNMGIIHTAKKNIKDELFRKKKDRLCFQLGVNELTRKQELDLENETERETKVMNLNQVRLCFEAFKKEPSGTYTPIAAPVYSNAINNRKSAQTGELRIVRMSIATGKMTGGDEMILLVEKVSKKNIKVRFYELNADGEVVWDDFAKFNESDVHHQYAIICTTPPYKNKEHEEPVNVYIELVRPSDDERSEQMKEPFTYKPVFNNRKRRRMYSSSSLSSSSMQSENIPKVVTNPSDGSFLSLCQLGDIDVARCNTDELFNQISGSFPADILERDGASSDSLSFSKTSLVQKSLPELSACVESISKLYNKSINASASEKEEIKSEILNIYKNYNSNNIDGESVVHDIINNNCIKMGIVLYKILEKLNINIMNDCLNAKNESALHCACFNNATDFIKPSLKAGCDPNIQDKYGNTALHVAVKEGNTKCVEFLLEKPQKSAENERNSMKSYDCDLTIKNDDGLTPLHMAIKEEQSDIIKMLLKANGGISKERCCKDGNNALHMAVIASNRDLVQSILEHSPDLDFVNDVNNANHTPIQLAKLYNNPSNQYRDIIEMLSPFETKAVENITIKEEELSSTSSDEEEEFIKTDDQTPEDQDESSINLKNFNKCLNNIELKEKLAQRLNESDKWKQIVETTNHSIFIYICSDAYSFIDQINVQNKTFEFAQILKSDVLAVLK